MRHPALVAAALLLAGCSSLREPASPNTGETATQPSRIVSLAPSLTEIVYALGCESKLIADTSFDDYPPAATKLPHVADLAHVDLERLARLAPQAVLALHDQEKEGSAISRTLPAARVAYLPNRNIDDLFADIVGVGAVCGKQPQAQGLNRSLRAQMANIAAAAERTRAQRPRVLYLLGLPGFTAGKGSFINDLIGMAGGDNVAGSIEQPYPNLDAESIVAMNPDVLVVAHDTPFGNDVRSREPWRSIRAVRDGRIEVPPSDDMMERLGPRLVQGLAWLAHAIHR